MAEKNSKFSTMIGSWSFLVGVVLAVFAGVFAGLSVIKVDVVTTSILVVLGAVIGLMNIRSKEVMPFMTSGIIMILASMVGISITGTVPVVSATLFTLLLIFVPAVIIVSIKNVFNLAKN